LPTYSSDLLPTTTGIKLGSASQAWDAYLQNLTLSGTFSATGTFNLKNLEAIRFADQFSGATVTNKIDAALADAATLLVVIPSTMGAGNATAIASGKAILDLRSGTPKIFCNNSVSVASVIVNDDGTLTCTPKSPSSNPSTTGVVRLANTDQIKSRNAGNSADLNVANMNASNVVVLGDTGGAAFNGPVTGVTNLTLNGSLSGVTSAAFSGQVTSSLATGTAPFSIASTTVVPNLNVATLNGVVVSGAPSTNQVLTATGATTAGWSSSTASGFAILDKQDVVAAIAGNSADQTIYTYTMPASTLAASKGVRVTFTTLRTVGAGGPVFKIFFGATAVSVSLADANAVGTWSDAIVFNNTGSTTAQWAFGKHWNTGGVSFDLTQTTPAETTTGSIVIKGTFNIANTTSIVGKGWLVELIS
jgi:hypothetical protein